MADLLQHGQHPNADQLNAFMEKASPEHERLAVLAHLADCEECRDVVFLAQKDLLPETQVAEEPSPQPWWKAWSRPVLVTGIAFACLLLLISVGVLRVWRNQSKTIDDAKNEATNPPSAATPSQIVAAPATAQPEASAESTLADKIPPASRRQLSRAVPSPSRPNSAASGVPGGVAGGILGGIGTGPENAPGQASSAAPQPSLKMHDQFAASAARASDSAVAATKGEPAEINGRTVARLLTTEGPLHLTIEHGVGGNDGLSVLRGTVRDPAGAVVPMASINLRGLSGQPNTSATSDATGGFTLASLPPGQYEIQVASAGFLPLTQRINLQAKDLAEVSPVLRAGSASQTVTVTAAPPLLQTQSAEIAAKKSPETSFVAQAALNGTLLGFDPSGALFRKGPGDKNWKKVKPKWHGMVVKLSVNPENQTSEQGASAAYFLVTTDSGESWTSPDGRHWKRH